MLLDSKSQKSWPEELVVKASGNFSPITSVDPRLGTTLLGGASVEDAVNNNFLKINSRFSKGYGYNYCLLCLHIVFMGFFLVIVGY